MTFAHPQGLWLLALAVPILAAHFYRGRVKRLSVPTLHFWEQVLVEEERRTALHRLRHYASLLLSLLALALLTSAVAEPRPAAPQRWAVVLDSTPSMGARGDDGRPRVAAAVDAARDFLRARARGDRAAVFDLSGPIRPFTADLEGLAARLEAPAPVRSPDAVAALEAVLAAGDDVRVVFFTDRPIEASPRVAVATVGRPVPNAGWVDGHLARRPGEKTASLTLELGDFGAAGGRTEILRINRAEVSRRPAVAGRRTWTLDAADGGLVEVVLDPPDAFPEDDTASFILPPLAPPPVLIVHPDRPDALLLRALQTLQASGVAGEVNATTPRPEILAKLGEGAVAVFDRTPPPRPEQRGTYLAFGAGAAPATERPEVVDWDRDSPLNRGADYAGLRVRASKTLDGPSLLGGAEGPLATWTAGGGRVDARFGFALEESDLAVRPAFLALLFNLCDWGAWRGLRSFPLQGRAGEPLRPERRLWLDEGELRVEQGTWAEAVPVRRGRPEAAPRLGSGFARISAAGRSEWIGANVFDAGESDLREPPAASAGPPPPAPWLSRVPWAIPALAAVLLLLLLEAWLFWK
ncbi:MAG TPA: BatA domain-containing protein [Planctomycetota bacterium]|nr:BatA domain-containing protein [Planctomycetota bacterium]